MPDRCKNCSCCYENNTQSLNCAGGDTFKVGIYSQSFQVSKRRDEERSRHSWRSRTQPLAWCATFREQVPVSHGSGQGLSWQRLLLPLRAESITPLFMTELIPHRFPREIPRLHVNGTWPPKSPWDGPLAAPTGAPSFSF